MISRCSWAEANDMLKNYHDTEWGVPLHDDRKLFEFFILDNFQAGISWAIILNKREAFRKAFDDFDFDKIAAYDDSKVEELLNNQDIVRNRLKILAAISNARAVIEVRQIFGSFDQYLWQFTDGKTLVNAWKTWKEVPAKTVEAEKMSKDMKQRGFKFAGPTICYAVMQSIGMVNDHVVDCFRYCQEE